MQKTLKTGENSVSRKEYLQISGNLNSLTEHPKAKAALESQVERLRKREREQQPKPYGKQAEVYRKRAFQRVHTKINERTSQN